MGTTIALVLKNIDDKPDRQTQRMGDRIADIAGGDKDNIMFIVAASFARGTLYDLMTGFDPTAAFSPDQIRTLSGQHLPDPERFQRLIRLIRENEDREKPKRAVVVMADAEFIKGFLRFYFSEVAKNPSAANLCDLIRPELATMIDTGSHAVSVIQPGGAP